MLRLKSVRQYNRITRKELADKIGLSEPTISAYEQGKREANEEALVKMANALNTSVSYLLGYDESIGELTEEEKAYIILKRVKEQNKK